MDRCFWVRGFLTCAVALGAAAPTPTVAALGAACSVTDYRAQGVEYRVMFAKNGAVQQYVLVQSSHNVELDNDVRDKLEGQYGPEGVNAPPLHIVTFRKSDGGMMVPDKAVDSCGRLTHFQ